jgi:hypothetical protein
LGGAEAAVVFDMVIATMSAAGGSTKPYAFQYTGQNLGAEATARAFRLLAEFFLANRASRTRNACRPSAEAAAHGVLSGTAHELLADFQETGWRVPGARSVRRA